MKTKQIYPEANALNLYLTINDCDKAIAFYKTVFDAVEKYRLLMPNGKIAHAEILIEGTQLMMSEENQDWGNISPATLGGNPLTISLYVKNVDAIFQKAIDAGATVIMPVRDEFYGDRAGQVRDPFGYKWMIATHIEDVSPEEMQIRMNKIFSGQ